MDREGFNVEREEDEMEAKTDSGEGGSEEKESVSRTREDS